MISDFSNSPLLEKIENSVFIMDKIISAKWLMVEHSIVTIEEATSLLESFYFTNSSKLLPLYLKVTIGALNGIIIEPVVGEEDVKDASKTLYSVRKRPDNYDILSEINITAQNQRLIQIPPSILINPELRSSILSPEAKKIKTNAPIIEDDPVVSLSADSSSITPPISKITASTISKATKNPKKQSSMMSFLKKKM